MKTFVYLSIVALALLLAFSTFLLIALIGAEKKLARYKASWLCKEKDKE